MTLAQVLRQFVDDGATNHFGASAAVSVRGVVVDAATTGWARSFAVVDGEPRLLPEQHRVAISGSTRFDVASLSKLFTAIIAMRLVSDGTLELDEPVFGLLPEFSSGSRRLVTLRHLLSHTSGFPEDEPLWDLAPHERMAHVLKRPLASTPGEQFSYSCVGYIAAGELVERATASSLPELLHDLVTSPLGMTQTSYGASGTPLRGVAATEFQPWTGRGIVCGEVHDEMAWALGGAAGNAGVFSTVDDLLRLGDSMSNGLDGLISADLFREMVTPQATDLADGFRQGLGFRICAPAFMGSAASLRTVGHTGFAGTSIVVDLDSGSTAVLLTNRVHPTRNDVDISELRRAVADSARQLAT